MSGALTKLTSRTDVANGNAIADIALPTAERPRSMRCLHAGVYMIHNNVDGKRYVGSSIDLVKRERDHWRSLLRGNHYNRFLQRAWGKHGKAAFEFVVLERCRPDICVVREQHWIDLFGAACAINGYNLAPIAGSVLGVKHTPEARAKNSRSKKGIRQSEEVRQRAAVINREINNRPEVKAKNAAAQHRRYASLAERNRTSVAIRKVRSTAESRERSSAASKEVWARPGQKEKFSAAAADTWGDPAVRARRLRGLELANLRPEVKERRARARQKALADPVTRPAILAGLRHGTSEAAKAKHSETLKRLWADPEWRAMMLAKRDAARARKLKEA